MSAKNKCECVYYGKHKTFECFGCFFIRSIKLVHKEDVKNRKNKIDLGEYIPKLNIDPDNLFDVSEKNNKKKSLLKFKLAFLYIIWIVSFSILQSHLIENKDSFSFWIINLLHIIFIIYLIIQKPTIT